MTEQEARKAISEAGASICDLWDCRYYASTDEWVATYMGELWVCNKMGVVKDLTSRPVF